MNIELLEESISEAERFLKRAEKLKKQSKEDIFYGCAATGAVKRASMDLTRSLANLRK